MVREPPVLTRIDSRTWQRASALASASFAAVIAVSVMTLTVTMPDAPARTVWLLAGPIWGSWLLLSPLVVASAQRWTFARGTAARSARAHAGILVAIQILQSYLSHLAVGALQPTVPQDPPRILDLLMHQRLPLTALTYGALVGLAWGTGTWWRAQDQALQLERAERQAAEARLAALSARLRPHVLFNTLHAIGALLEHDHGRGRAMIASLGDVLRDLLDETAPTEVPLGEEVVLLDRYLVIERHRFADRLRVTTLIEPEASGVLVPRLLLQPLVENAIHHGLARRGGGEVRISATLIADRLRVTVWNDGDPLLAPSQQREGVGLGTTRERLSILSPGSTVEVATPPEGGVATILEFPARRAGPPRAR